MWLLKLQMAISNTYSLRGIEDTEDEWKQLKDFVDWFISKLYVRKDIAVKSDNKYLPYERRWSDPTAYQAKRKINSNILYSKLKDYGNIFR